MCTPLARSEYCAVLRLLPACLPPFGLACRVGHTLSRRREVSRVPAARLSAMPRSPTPPRSPAPSPYRAPTFAFRCLKAVGPRMIWLRGSISSSLRTTAWSSRCLRFTTNLAVAGARLASLWVAGPCRGRNRTCFVQSACHGALKPQPARSAGSRHRMAPGQCGLGRTCEAGVRGSGPAAAATRFGRPVTVACACPDRPQCA